MGAPRAVYRIEVSEFLRAILLAAAAAIAGPYFVTDVWQFYYCSRIGARGRYLESRMVGRIAGPARGVNPLDSGSAAPLRASSRIEVSDTRVIRIPLEGLLEALLLLDRQMQGWMWRGTDHSITLDEAGDGSVTLAARRRPSAEPEEMRCERAFVAAALIHLCFQMRVPLPRAAQKEIEVTPEHASLIVTSHIEGPSISLTVPAPVPAKTCPPAAAAAPATAPAAEPEPAPTPIEPSEA